MTRARLSAARAVKIEQEDTRQNQVRKGIESQIATLTAYRKSLIHECVTGQRRITEADVRLARSASDHERNGKTAANARKTTENSGAKRFD